MEGIKIKIKSKSKNKIRFKIGIGIRISIWISIRKVNVLLKHHEAFCPNTIPNLFIPAGD